MYITVSYPLIDYSPEKPEMALQSPASSLTISIKQWPFIVPDGFCGSPSEPGNIIPILHVEHDWVCFICLIFIQPLTGCAGVFLPLAETCLDRIFIIRIFSVMS